MQLNSGLKKRTQKQTTEELRPKTKIPLFSLILDSDEGCDQTHLSFAPHFLWTKCL